MAWISEIYLNADKSLSEIFHFAKNIPILILQFARKIADKVCVQVVNHIETSSELQVDSLHKETQKFKTLVNDKQQNMK